METSKKKYINLYSTLKLTVTFNCFLAVVWTFNMACDKARSADSNNLNNVVFNNRSESQRSIKYFELTNREVSDEFSGISKEESLSIADKAFARDFDNKDTGNVVICERLMFWSVIYEESGDEYSVSKEIKGRQDNFNNNISRWRKKLPLPAENQLYSKNISKDEAENIAKEGFGRYLESINGGQDEIHLVKPITCEVKGAWRVYLVDKNAWETGVYPNSQLPDYLIDEKTGEILYDSKLNPPTE